jgi:hypothetical protein
MGFRNFLASTQVITNGAMANTDTLTSTAIDTKYLGNVGVQLVWTGTPNGTFTIEGSVNGTTYRAITTNPATISASGSASDHLISLDNWPFTSIRVKYVNASSSGTLQAYICAKEI